MLSLELTCAERFTDQGLNLTEKFRSMSAPEVFGTQLEKKFHRKKKILRNERIERNNLFYFSDLVINKNIFINRVTR